MNDIKTTGIFKLIRDELIEETWKAEDETDNYESNSKCFISLTKDYPNIEAWNR